MIIICQAAIYIKNHEDDVKTLAEAMNYIQESKKKFICESFKIDENKKLYKDKKIEG